MWSPLVYLAVVVAVVVSGVFLAFDVVAVVTCSALRMGVRMFLVTGLGNRGYLFVLQL